MPAIHNRRFLGIAPKVATHLLENDQAETAKDVNLWSQGLRPLGGLGTGAALDKASGDIQTLFRYDSDWLCWTQDVNAVFGPIANDTLEKLYFTGTDKPRVTTNALWDVGTPGTSVPPSSYILGIPAPTSAPVAVADGAGNITGDVVWVMTFVRKYSDSTIEESAPSPVSNSLTGAANKFDVTLPDGTMATATDYGITHKRLYRSTAGGAYLFVTEQTFATTTYEDNLAVASLGDAIETAAYLPPPDDMVGLIALPNGILAGFKGNNVYLSEPYRPHAYPLLNQYAANDQIVGLGNVGTTVVVITSGPVYIGRGVDPRAYSFTRRPGSYACTSKRSIASSDFGVLWSTPRGMAICDGVSVDLATKPFITKREWEASFYPSTIHGVVHDGRYYGWFSSGTDADGVKVGGGFVLDRGEAAFLTTLSDYSYAAHVIPEDEDLYVVQKESAAALANYVYEWEGDPTAPYAFEWKGKLHITPGGDNFAFAQIIADYGQGLSPSEIEALQAQAALVAAFNGALTSTDGALNELALNEGPLGGDTMTQQAPSEDYVSGVLTFQLWLDGALILTKDVASNAPFPLPADVFGEQHQYRVSGAVQVRTVTLATSMEELAAL